MLNAFRHHRNSHRLTNNTQAPGLQLVLNAFRHHRNSHPRSASSSRKTSGAQRLSASSEFSRSANGLSFCVDLCSTPFGIIGILTAAAHRSLTALSSAQRLSASSEFSHHSGHHNYLGDFVLNAFRHHRNSHQRETLRAILCCPVLNAFRHHRNSHCAGANLSFCHVLRTLFRVFLRFTRNSSSSSPPKSILNLTSILRIDHLQSAQASRIALA